MDKKKIFCSDESVYSEHITKRKSYLIQETKTDQFRIINNQGKLVWLPAICFVPCEIPTITLINIDDEIKNKFNDCIEVTISFSDEEKIWTTFMTTNYLKDHLSTENQFFIGNNTIIVEEITKIIIESTVMNLDRQNELIEVCRKLQLS
tara:strand:+ start:1870 stop:2316 length:447 start_codon:yes stop_codon:yes gene_type:complete